MKRFILFILIIAITSSCQKDIDYLIPDTGNGPDSTWHNIITPDMPVVSLRSSLFLPLHRDSLFIGLAQTNTVLSNGIQCSFPQGSIVTSNGQPVTGKIFIESHLLKKKGHFIRMSTATVSNNHALVSGGALFLRLRKDSNELEIAGQRQAKIRFSDSAIYQQMGLHYGTNFPGPAFNWEQPVDSQNLVIPYQQYYEIYTNRLRWMMPGYPLELPSAQTIVSTILPYNYTNANSMAYLVFNQGRTVIELKADALNRKFSSIRLPANKLITVVVISKQVNDYYLGHTTITTTGIAGSIQQQPVVVNPVIKSLDAIKTYLESL